MRYSIDFSKKVLKFLWKQQQLKEVFLLKITLLSNGDTSTLDIKPYK
jgi:hypothetical protein